MFDLEIQFDGYGYLLCSASRDGDLFADTWHETLDDAVAEAALDFGVRADQWQDVV